MSARAERDRLWGRRLWLTLIALLALVAVPVCAQDCAPDCQSASTTPWTILTVSFAGQDNAGQRGRIQALWVDDGNALWVGTDVGLGRYDGRAWQAYTHPGSAASNEIWALIGDGSSGIWAGTSNGLSYLKGGAWRTTLTTAAGLPDNEITVMASGDSESLWVGTKRGVARIDGRQVSLRVDEIDGKPWRTAVTALVSDGSGGAYAAAEGRVIHVSDAGVAWSGPVAGGEIKAFVASGDSGSFWVGTEVGLYRFDGTRLDSVLLGDGGAGNEPDVTSLAVDGRNGLWLGTREGLWHYDGVRIDQRFTARDGLAADAVSAIQRTDDETLWLSTFDDQISRGNPVAWRAFPAAGSHVGAIAGVDDRLWVVSDDGLTIRDGQSWQRIAGQAAGLWVANGAAWYGTPAGLQRLNVGSATPVQVDDLDGWSIQAIAGDGARDLWVGTDGGLFYLHDGERVAHYDRASGLIHQRIIALLFDRATGVLWVGTELGLSWREGDSWSSVTWEGPFEAKTVRALARGTDGSMWIGTGNGLRRLPPDGQADDATAWTLYGSWYVKDDKHPGLVEGTRLNALWVDDASGQLWVGSDAGLWGLDDNGTLEQADDIWVSSTAEDGLVSNEVNALWRDAEGDLWIGTAAGLIRHTPTTWQPAITSDNILVNDAPIGPELPWRQTEASFRFEGSSLVAERLAYRYRVIAEGKADPDDGRWRTWQPGQPKELDNGVRYQLEAQAFDPDLNTSLLISRTFTLQAKPLLNRTWVQVMLALMPVTVGAAILGSRLYRAALRPTYRESWEVDLIQVSAYPVCMIEARQRFARDLRLITEGSLARLFRPEGAHITTASQLPDLYALHAAWRGAAFEEADTKLEALANALWVALLPDDLGPLAKALQEAGERRDYHVRLRLSFAGATALAALPWEVARPAGRASLGVDAVTAISRRVPRLAGDAQDGAPAVMPYLSRRRALRVLLVIALPTDAGLEPLDAESERARLEQALRPHGAQVIPLIGAKLGSPESVYENTREALRNALLAWEEKGGIDVIHFIGHAGPPRDAEVEDGIVLYGEDQGGDYYSVKASDLIDIIADGHRRGTGPRLMVLNACRTAKVDGGETLAGLVPRMARETGLRAVVGMQYRIGDGSGPFTSTFYTALAEGQPVDYAVSLARKAMQEEIDGYDWTAPVLYLQVNDGMIYEP